MCGALVPKTLQAFGSIRWKKLLRKFKFDSASFHPTRFPILGLYMGHHGVALVIPRQKLDNVLPEMSFIDSVLYKLSFFIKHNKAIIGVSRLSIQRVFQFWACT